MKKLTYQDVIEWFEEGPLRDLDEIDRLRVEERMLNTLDSLDESERDITLWELYELSYSNHARGVPR
jgi:hypothetical protein